MKFNKFFNNITKAVMLSMVMCLALSGCTPAVRSKQEIPKPEYTKAGYAIEGAVEADGTVKLTYALIGLKEDKITYLYLDQIETNPTVDRHTFTNKELESAYGLLYTGNKGEWSDQIKAITTYISGNEMTIDEVNAIPTYQKDEQNTMVPKEGSELASGCELDLKPFLSVINKAYANTEEVALMYLAMGEDMRVTNSKGQLNVTFAFVGTDYRYKVGYSHLETYSYTAGQDTQLLSNREKAVSDTAIKTYADNETALQQFIVGMNMSEVNNLETYDAGDGINTHLPKKNTDLAAVCNIDLKYLKNALSEASGKL